MPVPHASATQIERPENAVYTEAEVVTSLQDLKTPFWLFAKDFELPDEGGEQLSKLFVTSTSTSDSGVKSATAHDTSKSASTCCHVTSAMASAHGAPSICDCVLQCDRLLSCTVHAASARAPAGLGQPTWCRMNVLLLLAGSHRPTCPCATFHVCPAPLAGRNRLVTVEEAQKPVGFHWFVTWEISGLSISPFFYSVQEVVLMATAGPDDDIQASHEVTAAGGARVAAHSFGLSMPCRLQDARSTGLTCSCRAVGAMDYTRRWNRATSQRLTAQAQHVPSSDTHTTHHVPTAAHCCRLRASLGTFRMPSSMAPSGPAPPHPGGRTRTRRRVSW